MDNIKKVSLKEEGIEEMNASSMIFVLWKCEKNIQGMKKFLFERKNYLLFTWKFKEIKKKKSSVSLESFIILELVSCENN